MIILEHECEEKASAPAVAVAFPAETRRLV